ncbi:hypothetical protein EB077_06905, partial [bacterium]|nr:hypothetical protein [bacterium]
AVLKRINNFKERQKMMLSDLEDIKNDLEQAELKFSNYTDQERETALQELDNGIRDQLQEIENSNILSVEEIRKELQLTNTSKDTTNTEIVTSTLEQLKAAEMELEEYKRTLETTVPEDSPHTYKSILEKVSTLTQHMDKLRLELTNTELVNEFVNSSFSESSTIHFN